ncbi:MAG: hypothetical protein LBH72_08020, partial [Proteiniphilum sp.]|nr:hypothetical protein [Proteiniphilum sp.]
MKKEITSSGSARVARGGSTRPDERKIQCDNVKWRSGNNQLGERLSGKGREHPPRRTISLLSDFFVNCLHCDSSDLHDLHD